MKQKLKSIPEQPLKPVKELSPELADKIWNSIQQKIHDDRVSKEKVLHHLKQLKAQMGKLKSGKKETHESYNIGYAYGITKCMQMIDKKIEKVKKL